MSAASQKIHPSAIIDPSAELAEDVIVGPYAIVGPKTRIGAGTKIAAHAIIEGYTTLGENCQVASGAVLGGLPQDLHFGGEESWVEIGNNVHIRECATVNRATGEGAITRLGNDCMVMAYAHLGHNCQVGNGVILANSVQLGGYVEVGDNAFIGGITAIHQFVKVGRLAIMSGFSATRQDIPPFSMSDNYPARIRGINKVGLKRRGFSLQERSSLARAFQLIWFSKLNSHQAIQILREEKADDPNVQELLTFIENSKRGIYRPGESSSDNSTETFANLV